MACRARGGRPPPRRPHAQGDRAAGGGVDGRRRRSPLFAFARGSTGHGPVRGESEHYREGRPESGIGSLDLSVHVDDRGLGRHRRGLVDERGLRRALPRMQRAHQASRLRSVDDHAVPPAGVEVVLPPGRLAGRRASAMARREGTARQPQGGDRLGRPRSEGALEDRLPFRRLCESGHRPRRARGSVGRRAVLRRGAVVPSRRAAGRRVGGAAPKTRETG